MTVTNQTVWEYFKHFLDRSDRKIFDQVFSVGHLYNLAWLSWDRDEIVGSNFVTIRTTSYHCPVLYLPTMMNRPSPTNDTDMPFSYFLRYSSAVQLPF